MVVNIYKDPYDVYIGRTGKKQSGYFGNPIRVGEYCSCCKSVHYTPGSTIPCYRKYFLNRIVTDPVFKQRVIDLKDKTLGCFCAPKGGFKPEDWIQCHGQVIEEWLNEY